MLLGKEFSFFPIWRNHLSRPLALIPVEIKGLRSKLMSLRLSSQDGGHIHVRGHSPHQSVEEIYVEPMSHDETYLLVRELIIGGASSEVRPGQGMHLMLTQRGASNEFTKKTDASTLLHVDLRGESIVALLPQGASSIV